MAGSPPSGQEVPTAAAANGLSSPHPIVGEEHLLRTYESLACGLLIRRRDGSTFMNPAAVAILGIAAGQPSMNQEDSWTFTDEHGRPLPVAGWPDAVALNTGLPQRNVVMGVAAPCGKRVWVQLDAVPLSGTDGTTDEVVVSFVDISAQKDALDALRLSEGRYRDLVEHSWDIVAIHDLSGRVISMNRAGTDILGIQPTAVTGMDIRDIVAPDVRNEFPSYLASVIRNGHASGLLRVVTASGDERIWEYNDSLRVEGVPEPLVRVMARDITDQRRAERALQVSERRFRALTEHAADAIMVLEASATVTYASPAMQRLAQRTSDQLVHANAFELLHAEDRAEAAAGFQELLGTPGQARLLAARIVRPDGSWRFIEMMLTNLLHEPTIHGLVANTRDVTERKQAEAALAHYALHDALTNLPNRTLLQDRLEQALLAAARDHETLALVMIDLDRFKDVNDGFGHHLGDLILQQLGQRLQAALRGSDTVARLGGDEFAIVLPRCRGAQDAQIAANKIMRCFDQPFEIEGQSLKIDGSLGIVLAPEQGADVETLLRRADIAMYVAKREQTGFALFCSDFEDDVGSRASLVNDLRNALIEGRLSVVYQPKIATATGRVLGLEALSRWHHPEHGVVSPARFVPLAEQSGLITQLTAWLVGEVCRQQLSWRAAGLSFPVAINLSMRSLANPRLAQDLAAAVASHNLSPEVLELELTETAVMGDPACKRYLQQLRGMGFRLSIDDFGTGYSSLAYLRQLPIDEIKIDQSFVRDMLTDDNDAVIVHSIIQLGHNLGLKVLAEGVEDADTLSRLTKLDCDGIQGYYTGRPMSPEALVEWHRRGGAGRPG